MHYSNPKVKWNDIAAWGEGKSLRVVICKLAIWVIVYHVWRQKKKMLLFIKTTMEVWLYHPKHGCSRRHPPMSGLRWRNGSHHLFRSRNQTNLYVEVYTPNLESDEFGNVLSTQACQAKWASLYLCICSHILIRTPPRNLPNHTTIKSIKRAHKETTSSK